MTKKRILVALETLNIGGTERHISTVMSSLAPAFDIYIWAREGDTKLVEQLRMSGVTVHLHNRASALGMCFSFFIKLFMLQPHIVHFFLPRPYLLGGTLSLLMPRVKRIMSRRSMNAYQSKYPSFVKTWEYWLHRRMDRILGNSQAVVDQLVKEEGAPIERTFLIYNGLNRRLESREYERASVRQEFGLTEIQCVMIVVANLIPYKGHQDLFVALSHLKTSHDWHLLVVGHDTAQMQNVLSELARQHAFEQRVTFTCCRHDAYRLMNGADIGLLVSHEEGFSNAILEGMVSGLPMIVTDVGGNAEAVQHGESGLVVPPQNPHEISAALNFLINDVDKRREFGISAKRRIENLFSLDNCVRAYSDLYNQID